MRVTFSYRYKNYTILTGRAFLFLVDQSHQKPIIHIRHAAIMISHARRMKKLTVDFATLPKISPFLRLGLKLL